MADELTLPPEILASLAAKRLGFQTSADTAKQQANQSYADQLYDLGNWNTDQVRNINDTFGSSNLFNSGIRVNEQGRLAQNFGDRQSQLGRFKSDALTNIDNMLSQQMSGLEDQRAQYALDYNRSQAQQALADSQSSANANAGLQAQIDALAGQQAPMLSAPQPSGPVRLSPGHTVAAVPKPVLVNPKIRGPQ